MKLKLFGYTLVFNMNEGLFKTPIEQEKYYKITREDGTSIFDASKPPIGIAYKDGAITKLPPGEFKNDPECGNGLHYGSIDSAVRNGLGLETNSKRGGYAWAVIPTILNFRVFEAIPLGKRVEICRDKYKTDELKTIELTPEEYLPLLLSSESSIVREIGVMKLSQQSEDLKKKFGFDNIKYKDTEWLKEWDYLKGLDEFGGAKVTTTQEYSESFHGKKIEGIIDSIDPINLVSILKTGEVLNIGWLERI